MPEVDAAVFTANKCLEALPGVAFAVAPVDRLLACARERGKLVVRSVRHLRPFRCAMAGGVSRFTPPAQILAALDVALNFLDAEGQPARLARYTANMRTLYDGMLGLGLTPWLAPDAPGTGAS